MIKHHPEHALLKGFADGQLSTSLSVAISAHVEMCPKCQLAIEALTSKAVEQEFAVDTTDSVELDSDMLSMIDSITSDELIEFPVTREPVVETVKGTQYCLPRSVAAVQRGKWQGLGKISRSRLLVEEGPVHASLLHIDKDGNVPEHTHNGFELTLLLDGSFEDETGTYVKGDFIWLDGKTVHSPKSTDGCLCYTVVSDSLQFTSGLSKLLNPIGALIY